MTCFLTAVRHEVNNLESSVVVQELEFAINRALYFFFLCVCEAQATNTSKEVRNYIPLCAVLIGIVEIGIYVAW